MPLYEYENQQTGERREIIGSMKNPPPEFITFEDHDEGRDWRPALVGTDRAWRRVFGAGLGVQVPKYEVTGKGKDGIPVSRTLPRRRGGTLDTLHGKPVLKHSDGGFTNLQGQPIVQNKNDVNRETSRSKLDWD